ncbi:MAG TPA: hypothetical protein VI636_16925 [Candidatus Angelobacter sp.]
MIMASALLFVTAGASAQQYPPVWTDIMNMQSFTSMASGNYYAMGNNMTEALLNTDLTGMPTPDTLSMPVATLPGSGGPFPPCGPVQQPVTFLESNEGTGITGVGFLGTFNSPGGLLFAPYNQPPYNITFQPDSNLFESVFFNERQCYDGEREYGFFLAASDNSIWAYWGTNEGLDSVVQGQVPLNAANNVLGNGVTIQPNAEYYFEMYPVLGAYGSCTFEIVVYTADNTSQPVFAAAPPLTSYGAGNLFNVDPGFCNAVASETGYVSANIEAVPWGAVTGNLPSGSTLNLNMQRVFVGKL